MALISKKIIDLLQLRLKNEEQSYRIYKAMSQFLSFKGFEGAAALWNKYAEEELEHEGWVFDYLQGLNIQPIVDGQEKPQNTFKNLQQVIAFSYQHELFITEECNKLAKACLDEQDIMTLNLAQRFVKEQHDELSKLQVWIDYLETFGDSKEALILLDNRMKEQAG